MKLYEISSELRAGINELQDMLEQGLIDQDTVDDSLVLSRDAFKEKTLAIAKYVKELESQALAMKEAEQRIADRRKSLESRTQSLLGYLEVNMRGTRTEKVEDAEVMIKFRKLPASLQLIDNEPIPELYLVRKEVVTPDKKGLLAALKKGAPLSCAVLVQGKTKLEIK